MSYSFGYGYVPLTYTDEKFWSYKVKMAKFGLLWKVHFLDIFVPFSSSNSNDAYICNSASWGLGIDVLTLATALFVVELGAVQKSKSKSVEMGGWGNNYRRIS